MRFLSPKNRRVNRSSSNSKNNATRKNNASLTGSKATVSSRNCNPMDHRVFTAAAVPAVKVPSERLIEFFANSAALKAFLETVDVANSNSPNAGIAMRQRKAQQQMLDATPVKIAPTAEELAVQFQPVTLYPVQQPMALQQQAGAISLTTEQRAANEETRQRQYAAQVAMLAAARLTP